MQSLIDGLIEEHQRLTDTVRRELPGRLVSVAELLIERIGAGHTVFWCGNGGSAADAQHLAAELVGRFNQDRRGLPSIALSTNAPAMTAIGNDYGFDAVFARQVEALARKGDVLMAVSTSGNSANVVRAVESARNEGVTTVGLLGRDGGVLADLCDLAIVVPGNDTARIQEMHILIGHIFCDLVERSCIGVDT